MQFRDGNTPVQEIARILDVDYVFEGVITRVGEDVQFSARLIDAQKDEYIWGDEFVNDLGSIQILQAAITQMVASQAGVSLTQSEQLRFAKAKPVDPEAQEAYYRGRYHWGRFTKDDFYEALRWYELAKEEDPEYALAYFGIAQTWGALHQMGFLSAEEALPQKRAAAEKAIKLDASIAQAHHMLAITEFTEWNWQASEPFFQDAININPNWPDARAYYSHYLILTGRNEEGIVQANKALDLEPTSVLVQALNGWSMLSAGNLEDAEARFQDVVKVQPNNLMALDGLWDVYTVKKLFPEALEYAQSLYAAMDQPEVVSAFTYGFEKDGYTGAMLQGAELLASLADSVYSPAYDVARLYLNAGQYQEALIWLAQAVEEHDPNTPYIVQPLWDPIRDEPQFIEILRRVYPSN